MPPPAAVITKFSTAAQHQFPRVAHVLIAPTTNKHTPHNTADIINPVVVESTNANGRAVGKAPRMNKMKLVPPATTGRCAFRGL